jgi:small subunit ribosomal protein S16
LGVRHRTAGDRFLSTLLDKRADFAHDAFPLDSSGYGGAMSVHIRLTRCGGKKKPFYRIVAIDKSVKRDGDFLENLGYYDPKLDPPELKVERERYDYWMKNGAQASDTVRSLVKQVGGTQA